MTPFISAKCASLADQKKEAIETISTTSFRYYLWFENTNYAMYLLIKLSTTGTVTVP